MKTIKIDETVFLYKLIKEKYADRRAKNNKRIEKTVSNK